LKVLNLDSEEIDRPIFNVLFDWWEALQIHNVPVTIRTFQSYKRPTLQIKDLTLGTYFDLACKIICKCQPGTTYQMWGVTDFTSNNMLDSVNEKLDECNPNVAPQYLVVLTLWDNNANVDLPIGSYIFLRNAHSKIDANDRLEISLHGDPKYHSKQNIRLLDFTSNEYKQLKE
jgi:hypothetical protein